MAYARQKNKKEKGKGEKRKELQKTSHKLLSNGTERNVCLANATR